MSGAHFLYLQNYPGAHFGNLQYYKGRKCVYPDSRELISCCMKTIYAGREIGIAHFKCKLSLNIEHVYPNHFMNL